MADDPKAQPITRLSPEALQRAGFGPDAPSSPLGEVSPAADFGWTEGEFFVRRRTAREAKTEEEAEAVFAAAVQRVIAASAREGKKDKKAKRAGEADPERRVRAVEAACLLAGRKPAKTDICVDDIRPHLPKEERHATVRELKEALGEAKKRRAAPARRDTL